MPNRRLACGPFLLAAARQRVVCHPEAQPKACPEPSRRDLAVTEATTAGFFAARFALAQNDRTTLAGDLDFAATPYLGAAPTWRLPGV
jgi:hypothetical protein